MNDPRVDETIRNIVYSASGRFRDLQKGKIPTVYDGFLEYVNEYTIDEVVYKDPKSTIISTPSIFKDYYKNKYKRSFSMSLKEAIRLGYAEPLMLFIGGLFVKWSKITVIHDYNKDYLLLDGIYDGEIKLIYLNTKVDYREFGADETGSIPMGIKKGYFIFDKNGYLKLATDSIPYKGTSIFISNIRMYKNTYTTVGKVQQSYAGYDSPIYPENIIVFSTDGKLIDSKVNTYPGGYYLVEDENNEKVSVIYSVRNDIEYHKIQNYYRPDKYSILLSGVKNLIEGKPTDRYLEAFLEDLNFDLNPKVDWTTNRKDIIRRIFEYNPFLIMDAYDSNVRCESYTGAEMKEIIGGETGMFYGTVKVFGYKRLSQALIFINGLCATNYIKHYLNKFEYQFMNLQDEDVIEIMYFENINNNAYTVTFTKDNPYLPTDEIDLDELAIFSPELESPEFPNMEYSSYTTFPVDFSIEDGKIILPEYYYGRPVTITSKNRYAYRFMDVKEDTVSFELGEAFAYCSDIKRYIVFINGKRLDNDEYFITCMKNTRPFSKVRFYSRYLLTPGDRVAVYYLPAILDGTFNSDIFNDQSDSGVSENGYLYVNKDKIPYPLSRDLFFIFNDGKKIPYHHLKNIGSNVMAITESMEIGKPFISAYHIPIPELEGLMTKYPSVYDSAIELCTEEDLNRLFNVFTTITYTDNVVEPNYDRAALINEVIRDNWMAPGVNYGIPITYDYYTDMFGYEDSEGNIIFPTMDATKENSIIFTED